MAGAVILLSGCPTSGLLDEVKNRTEGAYSQLASLSVPSVTLTPDFSPTVTSYTGTVGYSVTSLTVVPMSYQSTATIEVNGAKLASGASSSAVPLVIGLNTITLSVKYTDSAVTTYTLKITRLSQVDLATLAVTGASTNPLLSPPFRPSISSYTLGAANTETSITITPTAADPLATVVVNPTSPINVASLAVGATMPVTVTVTTPGGGSSRVYSITVSRLPIGYVLDTSWGTGGRVGPDLSGNDKLWDPNAIAVGGTQVFIHDTRNFRIQNFTTAGAAVQRWGSNGNGSGQFNDTRGSGIAYDSARGFVYDVTSGRIQKFNYSDGTFLLEFGSGLREVSRIACDPSGNVYVADKYNSRVLKFDSNGNQQGAPWPTALQPTAITADSSNVYVGENNQIQKYTTAGSLVATWNTNPIGNSYGMALSGSTLYVGTWNAILSSPTGGPWTPTTIASSLPSISDLATDGTYLYTVSVEESRCYKYSNTNPVVLQTSWGSDLTTPPGMKRPQRAVVDSSGNLYVCDTNNNRVLKFDSTGNNPVVLVTGLNWPNGVAIDATGGWLYVADTNNNRVAKFNLGSGTYVSAITGVNFPKGVAVDGSRRLYVANTNAGNVLMYDYNGNPQGSPVTGFSSPNAVAVDASNNIYVADSGNYCIKKYSANMGGLILQWGSGGSGNGQFSNSISDVSAGGPGVFVSCGYHQMQQFDANGTYVSTIPSGQQSITSPQWIIGEAVDSSGNLYIVDGSDGSVRRYRPQ